MVKKYHLPFNSGNKMALKLHKMAVEGDEK